ncbi:hypothetical protein [Hoeflea sp. IMCC20628]|uniref:hypothetical protein n=1 Tax=Hoeflea sp. IMCC20628 TaxID=1620421 RepID=UPI0012E039C1|nr:hypothetical protein [Hoeflea sp. IMCC20628]
MTFARGFLLTDRAAEMPVPGWIEAQIGQLHLWHDPRTPLWTTQSGERWIAVLGHFVDVRRPSAQEPDILAACAGLERTALLTETDHWSGRFVLIFGDTVSSEIAPDAIGSRPVYYALSTPFVAGSHAALVADVAGAAPNAEIAARLSRRVMYGLPGDFTPWRDIHVLTPNQTLDTATRKISRFWPRKEIGEVSVQEAASRVAAIMTTTMNGLANRPCPLVFSLTAGLDSRITLAASREQAKALTCFTYSNGNHHLVDMYFAKSAALKLGLKHKALDTNVRVPAKSREEFESVMSRISPRPHFPRGSYAYTLNFPQNALHIRSSGGEIARSFFRDPDKCFVPESIEPLVKAWGGDLADRDVDIAAFEAWAERAQYWRVTEVDLLDVFHWEHRMGTWLSELCLESDIAFDTHVMFSCRALLEAFLSAPLDKRRKNAVFHAAIQKMWPGFMALPINGETVFWR